MNNNDQLESLLGNELHDRADDFGGGAGLTFTEVRGRATSIRRRRRAVAGVGIAAVLAVVVPVSINAFDNVAIERTIDPAPSPSPALVEVVRKTLTLDGLPRGSAPALEYFTGAGVVLPDSGLQPLAESWQALVPSSADSGWLALSPSRDEIVGLTASFEETTTRRDIAQDFVSSPDRSQVAWTRLRPSGQTLVLHSTTDSGKELVWDFPAAPQVNAVDFLSDSSLLFQTTDQLDGKVEIGIAEADGTTKLLDGNWVKARAASPETGLVAVQTRSKRDGSGCFGIIDPTVSTTATVWGTCDYSLGAFSPDGRYVLASDPYLSGMGISSLSVLDAKSGDLVTSFKPERTAQIALLAVAWESADTLAAVAFEEMSYSIIRLGVDGTLEEAVKPVDGGPLGDQGFYLGEDRRRGF